VTATDLPKTFGNYSLLKLLARGGMGEIYLARTQSISNFEKYYAVKKLLKKFTKDPDVGARFIDEAKLGARLQHPNIVQVFDLGSVNDELYMATEFVDGFDLRRVLRFCHEKKKRIPLDIALFIVREILSGLSYAHRQLDADGNSIALIHRDISPQNVLVSFEGEVKIIDFGLAKSTQRSQETQANVLLGNFGYMSPEQARGHKLDVRTDVYSTGVVLFELVTRTKRFVDENPLRLLEMVARPTPVLPSDRVTDVPKAIDQIYAHATAPDRAERYETAEGFREDVMGALHKINPRCSREHLAQFLNHLFLGGQAPAAPDTDALDAKNKSVAIKIQDLYQQSEAFQRTKEQDVHDRRLSHFADDAPQTDSHALMRACRSGDTLSHKELTGEAVTPVPDRSATTAPVDEDPPPVLVARDETETLDSGVALTSKTDAMPKVKTEETPVAKPSSDDSIDIDEPEPIAHSTVTVTKSAPIAPAQSPTPSTMSVASAPQVSSSKAVRALDAEPATSTLTERAIYVGGLTEAAEPGAPTSVYESPSWPSEAMVELSMDEVESLDEGEMPPPSSSAIPEADDEPMMELEDAGDMPMPPPEIDVFALPANSPETHSPSGVFASPRAGAEQAVTSEVRPRPDDQPRTSSSPRASTATSVVTSVVERNASSSRHVEREEPTVVIDMGDLPRPDSDDDDDLDDASGEGVSAFREGGGSESLIIDFDVGGIDDDDGATIRMPPAPGRPAKSAAPVPPAAAAPAPPAAAPPVPKAAPAAPVKSAPVPPAPTIRPAAPAQGPRPKMKPITDVSPPKRGK
jgi:serine/threonine protein kinase